MTESERLRELLDELLDRWSGFDESRDYYLGELIPRIVAGTPGDDLMPRERQAVDRLRSELDPSSWRELGQLLARRFNEREAARAAREVEQRAAARGTRASWEERRAAAEAERRRQEQERRDEEARQLALEKQMDRQRRAELARKREARWELRREAEAAFQSSFLTADEVILPKLYAYGVTEAEYEGLKVKFVQQWCEQELNVSLDAEQAEAVGTVGGDVLVTARAGSGKTRVLVTRATFLIRHCGVKAHELLLLAFNRRAANEMEERLQNDLPGDLPHVMTFHALAYALVHPGESLIYDDLRNAQLGQSREIQEVIDQMLREGDLLDDLRELMLSHFRSDWEQISEGGYDLDIDRFLARRRALPRESLNGDFVKSHGEKVIANLLFENSVEYHYERGHFWNGAVYRPDFTLPIGRGGVVIEYFGMAGDPAYDAEAHRKRAFWSDRDGWTLIEVFPSDVAEGEELLWERISGRLVSLGVKVHRRSEEEIWELVRERAVDRFSTSMRTFVARCRKERLTTESLSERVSAHVVLNDAEGQFLRLAQVIYRGYLDRLAEMGLEDFDGLLGRAADLVGAGTTTFSRRGGRETGDLRSVRHVLIDEFQDFAQLFLDLCRQIRRLRASVEFFCVGDDWQAINAFAGSDLRYFDGFPRYFGWRPMARDIATNYRSAAQIVDVGNNVMRDRGRPARPSSGRAGELLRCDFATFQPTSLEQERHRGDRLTPMVLRLVWRFLQRGEQVVLLSRRSRPPYPVSYSTPQRGQDELERFLAHLRSHLPEHYRRHLSISTVHGYKGLERPAVVVLDGIDTAYPLIHPTWAFQRIFGDTLQRLDDEERRLFYVALTRAKNAVAVVTERGRTSPFLIDANVAGAFTDASWRDIPPPPSLDGHRLLIRAFNAYEIRNELKRSGFRFNGDLKCWELASLKEGFSWSELVSRPWMTEAVRLEVVDEGGGVLHSTDMGKA